MKNNFFATSKKLTIKSALNEAITKQISCKGLLNNWILGESRG